MPRLTTPIPPAERVERAKARLHALSGGSVQTLATLRDPDKNSDLDQRCELAYLVQLCQHDGRRPVDVNIAGRPNHTARRVFGRVTHQQEEDGSILDIYTGQRRAAPWAIPFFVETTP